MELCQPRYGTCTQGQRTIPIPVLDVAGLVPGASMGAGLGNRFLDDLRHAQTFIHVVDASGTTDAEGKETSGYDPTRDIAWLIDEIRAWVNSNLRKHWSAVKRKANAGFSLDKILARYFGGYGADRRLCAKVAGLVPSSLAKKPMEEWDDTEIDLLVDIFVRERFPMVIALNKIDLPDADRNIESICNKYPDLSKSNSILCMSTLAENFLKKLQQEEYIFYAEGTDQVYTHQDQQGLTTGADAEAVGLPAALMDRPLKPLGEKTQTRLDELLDLVLFRYGGTGCRDVVNRAVELASVVPFYPVRSVHNYGPVLKRGQAVPALGQRSSAFVDCYLVPSWCTIKEAAEMLFSPKELEHAQLVMETVGGRQLSEDDMVKDFPIVAFKFRGEE